MNGDPFDRFKEQNPMPDDRLPSAPMSMAERIMSERPRRTPFSWPAWSIAAVAAVVTFIVAGGIVLWLDGDGEAPVAGSSTTTTTKAPTTNDQVSEQIKDLQARRAALANELLEARGTAQVLQARLAEAEDTGIRDQIQAELDAVQQRIAALDEELARVDAELEALGATPPTTLSPDGEGIATEIVIYLMSDDPTATVPGPFLIPVTRSTDDPVVALGAVETLLSGTVLSDEEAHGISSAIPAGTTFNDLEIEDGVATIDLSSEFTSGGGSLSMMSRVAQVVFTLTRFDTVDGVRFLIDGVPTTVFGGEGITVSDPATRADFEALMPAILMESPAFQGSGLNPLVVTGTANVFEATVSAELLDASGDVLWEGFTTATCGTGCRGDFTITIPYDVPETQLGLLRVWEASALDGSETNVREHPVFLEPAPDEAICSASAVSGLEDQSGLPAAVAETRGEVFAAAASCDWGRLDRVLGTDFSYSFGAFDDPIGYWQELEQQGDQPMRFLAELLDRPFATIASEGSTYYVWPSAFARDAWAEVTDAEREALRPLYDDADFTAFADFGAYIGYRVGISEAGEWAFFVAGD